MALRSVVLEAPASPPARRTVVVREGAPAPKGRLTDILVGIIGLLVILAAIGLAWYLPDRTYVNPQFRLSFPETTVGELGSRDEQFVEGSLPTMDFTYEMPDGNINTVTILYGFEDEQPYSTPDRFTLELIAPNGTSYGVQTVVNPPPAEGNQSTDAPSFKDIQMQTTFSIVPAPTEQIVTGLTHDEAPEQVLARLEPPTRVDNGGTWIVRVTLEDAGDCPTSAEQSSYPAQPGHCVFGSPSNLNTDPNTWQTADPGNLFVISNAGYTFYTAEIQELG